MEKDFIPNSQTGAAGRRRAEAVWTEAAVANVWNVPLGEIRAPTRRRAPVALARQVAMYLTHVIFGISLTEVGRHFGRDRKTAAWACERIEDRRDDPDFDRLLDALGLLLESRIGPAARP
ncbi:helix-turn-helix domain-containing protein [Parvibaculum sp.]|uniref:helix-turn-helix domain-containing protein n=1 Tax=Parvibaculum sp. TaxID=2024848 RepID=UPI0034A00FD1